MIRAHAVPPIHTYRYFSASQTGEPQVILYNYPSPSFNKAGNALRPRMSRHGSYHEICYFMRQPISHASDSVMFGIAGIGGYAGTVRNLLLDPDWNNGTGEPLVRLAAVCEPDEVTHAATISQLRGRGVAVYANYHELLNSEIEAVWLPVPIHLHRTFCEQALAAGKAVLCEKPAAGAIDDVDAMIAARDRAGLPVAIGYQNVYETTMPVIKRMLADGIIGRITDATLHACWPRGESYYQRNNWAGAMKRNGVWVLDSPANNALAHFINIVLFMLGPAAELSAQPIAAEAELYRVNPIENYDTVSLRLTLQNGVRFLVLLTHACAASHEPRVTFHGERGRLDWSQDNGATFLGPNGGVLQHIARDAQMHRNMVRRMVHCLRGHGGEDILMATLEVARAHTLAVNGASSAARIVDVPPSYVQTISTKEGSLRVIASVEQAFAQCAAQRQMLNESNLLPWTVAPGLCDLRGYRHFAGPKT